MRLKFILISLLSVAFIADFAFADTVIKAEVDKVKITVGQTLTYKLTIESSEKEIPGPNAPEFKGFSVLSQSQASQISIAQGQLKTSVVYAFILAPDGPGKFNIPPSEIKIKGKAYSSSSFEIEVAQKASPPADYPTESEEPQFTI
jgi:hypothetical protein